MEWKFARSKLYMEYIKDGSVLPIPFNIIPTPALIIGSMLRIFRCKKKKTSESPSYRIEELSHSRLNGNLSRRKQDDEILTFKVIKFTS